MTKKWVQLGDGECAFIHILSAGDGILIRRATAPESEYVPISYEELARIPQAPSTPGYFQATINVVIRNKTGDVLGHAEATLDAETMETIKAGGMAIAPETVREAYEDWANG